MVKGGERRVKKAIGLLLTVLLAFSLSACASGKGEVQRVKCPACEYEFDLPAR